MVYSIGKKLSSPDPGPVNTPTVTVAVLEGGRRRAQIYACCRWVEGAAGEGGPAPPSVEPRRQG
jgi:hypothetical protein